MIEYKYIKYMILENFFKTNKKMSEEFIREVDEDVKEEKE